MAARTCLLCGKALSRFAATGDDFCSREHRNQYRLRQGMERLAEANQVASVMRRREHPRQIPTVQLRAPGQTIQREFAQPLRAPLPEPKFPRIPTAEAGMPGPGTFLRPIARGESAPQILPRGPITISGGQRGPSVAAYLSAHVAQAPFVKPVPAPAQVASRKRLTVAPKQKYPAREMRCASALSPAVFGTPPRKLGVAAKGRALRVSLSTGFRLPDSKQRSVATTPTAVPGMRWPELLPIDATRRRRGEGITCSVDPAQPDMRLPRGPSEAFAGNFRWPGVSAISVTFVDAAREQRSTFVPFGSEERR